MTNNATINLSKELNNIAKKLDSMIENASGERVGFTLIVYTPERASYIGSVERKYAIEQMEHLIELWKSEMPDIPAHDYKG